MNSSNEPEKTKSGVVINEKLPTNHPERVVEIIERRPPVTKQEVIETYEAEVVESQVGDARPQKARSKGITPPSPYERVTLMRMNIAKQERELVALKQRIKDSKAKLKKMEKALEIFD